MTDTAQREWLLTCINEATQAGARQQAICELINLEERTLQRWQAAESLVDKRTLRHHSPPCLDALNFEPGENNSDQRPESGQ